MGEEFEMNPEDEQNFFLLTLKITVVATYTSRARCTHTCAHAAILQTDFKCPQPWNHESGFQKLNSSVCLVFKAGFL